MENFVLDGFNEELEKQADMISKELFSNLPRYQQEKLVAARDTISEATKKDTKIPESVREKMIEGAFESLKNTSYGMVNALRKDKENTACEPVSPMGSQKLPKLKL